MSKKRQTTPAVSSKKEEPTQPVTRKLLLVFDAPEPDWPKHIAIAWVSNMASYIASYLSKTRRQVAESIKRLQFYQSRDTSVKLVLQPFEWNPDLKRHQPVKTDECTRPKSEGHRIELLMLHHHSEELSELVSKSESLKRAADLYCPDISQSLRALGDGITIHTDTNDEAFIADLKRLRDESRVLASQERHGTKNAAGLKGQSPCKPARKHGGSRKRYDPDQDAKLALDYRSSGLTIKDFAKGKGRKYIEVKQALDRHRQRK